MIVNNQEKNIKCFIVLDKGLGIKQVHFKSGVDRLTLTMLISRIHLYTHKNT